MARITLNNYRTGTAASDEQCRALECGDILYFPQIPFAFPCKIASRASISATKRSGIEYTR
jgi:hypothetical protein